MPRVPTLFLLTCGMLMLALGCNDDSLRTLDPDEPPPRDGSEDVGDPGDSVGDDDDPGDDGSDDDGGPYDDGEGDDEDGPGDGPDEDEDDGEGDDDDFELEPPPLKLNTCPEGTEATFSPDEIYVLSWDTTTAEGVLNTPAYGWYHVYDFSLAESGDSQWNETVAFRVINDTNPTGQPYWESCAGEWWVEDADNLGDPTPGAVLYVGTFWLESGDNTMQMNHYCPVYRAGACTAIHRTEDPGATCDSSNVNSAHFEGHGLCLVEAELPPI